MSTFFPRQSEVLGFRVSGFGVEEEGPGSLNWVLAQGTLPDIHNTWRIMGFSRAIICTLIGVMSDHTCSYLFLQPLITQI